jgi:hypothetical protein
MDIMPPQNEPTPPEPENASVTIGQRQLRRLGTIGVLSRSDTALNVYRGGVVMLQHRLITVMAILTTAIMEQGAKPKKSLRAITAVAQLANAIAQLAAQVTDSQRMLLEIERLSSRSGFDESAPTVKSFGIGEKIVPMRSS